jgi:cell division protein FtsQ
VLIRRRNPRRREVGERTHSGLAWLPALPWRALGLAAASMAALVAAGAGLLLFLNQPIEHIEVEGRFQHLTALDVEQAARARLHGAGLASVRLDVIGAAVRALPWVESVSVERRWPRGLAVRVAEQRAVALWNGAGLVNAHGELFRSEARFAAPELPRLGGPSGSEAEVVARYLALQGRVTESGMRLVALQLDARGAWQLELDNGVSVRVGRKQVEERLARFTDTALRLIAQRAHDIDYVDLRYTNGFAIGWRSSAARMAGTEREGKPHG